MTAVVATDHPSMVSWACPDAELVLRADAPRDEWLIQRRQGIGGSDASTVAGVNPWSSRYELWLDKTGQLPDQAPTPAMVMGTKMEPVITDCFRETFDIPVRRSGLMRSRRHPFMQVTVDGLTADGGILECKSTNWRLAPEWEGGQVADHAEIQVQHGLAVTGRSHSWVAVMVDGGYPQFRRVQRDDDLIATLIEMEHRFWNESVVPNRPPATEAKALDAVKLHYAQADDYTINADNDDRDLVAAWLDAKKVTKASLGHEKAIEAQIRERLGHATAMLDVDGTPLLTCRQNGVFAASRFAEAHPDLAEICTTSKPVLDVDRIKEEHPTLYTAFRARTLRPSTKKAA